jgi:membrane-bound lytic murein transglycosylase B
MTAAKIILVAVFGCVACASLLVGGAARADNEDAITKARSAFVDKMVADHGFDRASLTKSLGSATIDQKILDAMARPAERVVPWHEYRAIFINDARVAAGVRFWTEHAATIDEISERYGVAPEMLVAIVGVETYFGQRMGKYRVLDALATLAFAYPPRAKFFAGELEEFLLLSREEGLDLTVPLGSYAGAMGAGQFIPSSYRAYAVDANADGKRDIWSDWEDVLGSVANYFKIHGWRTGEPVADGRAPSRPALDLGDTVGSLTKWATSSPPGSGGRRRAPTRSGEGWRFGILDRLPQRFRVITRYNRPRNTRSRR